MTAAKASKQIKCFVHLFGRQTLPKHPQFPFSDALLKLSGLLAMIYWLALPELSLLKWCCVLNLALILICFVMSYVNMPPIPALDAPSKIRYMAWGREWLAWLCRIAIATSSVWVLYNYGAHFSAADLRLGIIITATVYLLSVIVGEQFPTIHLAALRGVRQNLAFKSASEKGNWGCFGRV